MMQAERIYFLLCLILGRLLRSARYSIVRIVEHQGERQVLKRRSWYAPFLIWMGASLMKLLDTGVQVLPQPAWEERERLAYQRLYGVSIRTNADHILVLPSLPGQTLAALLTDPVHHEFKLTRMIEPAVVALADLHRLGLTHGDAMAENVMVDVDAGIARWFDFETIHEPGRPMQWRRADDVRALVSTCLCRTALQERDETLSRMLDVYGDDEVTRVLAASFTSVFRRSLGFHLAQAGLAFQDFRGIGRRLERRLAAKA